MAQTTPLPLFAARRARRRESGFTLLEVLVAIIVLSFGVLGVVGLQAASLQANKEARNQSAAVRLGRELGDMMRGNKDVAILASTTANPYLVSNFTSASALPPAPDDCSSAACATTTTVAQFHIRDWLSRVRNELPGARVVICVDSAPYDSAGLPTWACTNTGGMSVVKMGWTRQSTDRAASAASAVDQASVPAVVLPLIPGSAT
jgi:type IV pilus assembly protein PilV